MHLIEPYFNWRHIYISEDDTYSPFYGKEYSEFYYENSIYNFAIHPQWDGFGSPTLFLKVLYCNYNEGYMFIEFIGEWNDAVNNDIMLLFRDVIEVFIENGIDKFILIGSNVLNIHTMDVDYYEEWYENIKYSNGYIFLLNFLPHVISEMQSLNLGSFLIMDTQVEDVNWANLAPYKLFEIIDEWMQNANPPSLFLS